MLKVFKECCQNCLLSPDRIVSGKRAKEIIQDCVKKQTHFICHKSSMKNGEVICKTFFDQFGHYSQMVRIAGRLNMIEHVPQTDNERLTPFKERK